MMIAVTRAEVWRCFSIFDTMQAFNWTIPIAYVIFIIALPCLALPLLIVICFHRFASCGNLKGPTTAPEHIHVRVPQSDLKPSTSISMPEITYGSFFLSQDRLQYRKGQLDWESKLSCHNYTHSVSFAVPEITSPCYVFLAQKVILKVKNVAEYTH